MDSCYIFLDIDGVLTSQQETPGSYINHEPEEYGLSKSCVKRLLKLADQLKAKVIVSSNWRRFTDDGTWCHMGTKVVKTPLPALKKVLGDRYAGDLTHEQHLTKSEALELWFEDTGLDWKACRYVVFDDDLREGFSWSKFRTHFILTNDETGLTDADCKKAVEILSKA